MRRFFRENGLIVVMFGLFLAFVACQSIAGLFEHNRDQIDHGQPPISYVQYIGSGDFIESVFENWESEFLQMAIFVVATVFLYQKGSSQSKDPDEEESVDADPRESQEQPEVPKPIRMGGLVLVLYENSLGLALLALFILSFSLHAIGGVASYNQQLTEHGEQTVSLLQYVGTSRFWFESFQNWQSEFLALGAMAILSIWLRHRGSAESKPVAAPHGKTES